MENRTLEEKTAEESLSRALDAGVYWAQFLGEITQRGMRTTRPPRVILLRKKKKAEAFAKKGDIFYTTRLIDALSFEEQKAVMVHELWHIIKKHGEYGALLGKAEVTIEILIFTALLLTAFSNQGRWFFVSVATALFTSRCLWEFFYCWYSRQRECSADKYAALVADPNILARALVKLGKVNKTWHLNWWEWCVSTHPHPARRLRYLRRWRDEKRKMGTIS